MKKTKSKTKTKIKKNRKQKWLVTLLGCGNFVYVRVPRAR
jgi:hypothetical protein